MNDDELARIAESADYGSSRGDTKAMSRICSDDVPRLLAALRAARAREAIARAALEYIAGDAVKGPARFPVTVAVDALTQMSVVEG